MARDTAFQKQVQRIGEIVEQLESSADPGARAMAKELLESLLALHGAGLERILELTAETGESGTAIIAKCGHDELVSSLLLLYGLHPDDLRTRVTRAFEKSRRQIESHGGTAELVSVSDDGAVRLRLEVKSGGCGSSASSLKSALEAAIQDAAPDATSIVVEEVGGSPTRSGFVSLAQLESGQAVAALSISRTAQRSGD
ncbi:MAG: NifU family protein [Candidatus Acidiferrum sp.]|jgi:Fe-S cluster biogenesis protein NfuA